jgi:hypothetical protein
MIWWLQRSITILKVMLSFLMNKYSITTPALRSPPKRRPAIVVLGVHPDVVLISAQGR